MKEEVFRKLRDVIGLIDAVEADVEAKDQTNAGISIQELRGGAEKLRRLIDSLDLPAR